ncbi:MAG: hydroxyacid dehydrogenase [Clostridiales bacterium]|nr:hydroxyacid dehydrogenase [Clostridiales bacterium]
MKIVMLEPLAVKDDVINELSKELKDNNHELVVYDSVTNDIDELIERANGADALIIANNPLPGQVINSLDNLKFISVAFTGVDHVDLDACRAKAIKVSNAAGYSTQAVAELVVGMIISKLRNIVECNVATRKGLTKDGLVGSELAGKTVGIVGTGAIGLKTAELLKAFGCKLLGYSRSKSQAAQDLGIEYVSLEDLLKASDIVSLHTPLTEETRHLINSDNIKLMKETALLVNCARGPVVDIEALAQALKEKKIAGAAIDVFEIEPPLPTDHVLFDAETALLTPHVAFATDESMVRRAKIAFDNIYAWMEDKQINTII